MTAKRKALGKGLSALLGDAPLARAGTQNIPVDKIQANPFQPRQDFDEASLQELARSIQEVGLIQPIVVRKKDDQTYELIAGERRLRAVKLLGWKTIPAFIRDIHEDTQLLELALVENLQRQDLNPLEVALTYARLIDEFGYTHEALAQKVGKDRTTITNYLRLLNLPPEIQASLRDGQITMGHARALLALEDAQLQKQLWREIIERNLSVRETERRVQQLKQARKKKTTSPSPFARELQEKIAQRLNLPIQVTGRSPRRGRIIIQFRSEEELNRLLKLLGIS